MPLLTLDFVGRALDQLLPTKVHAFKGKLDLSRSMTIYEKWIQEGPVVFDIEKASIGGSALLVIIANGSAINIPSNWIFYGGDDISVVNGDENHISVFYKDEDTIYYSNKVI